MSSESVIPIKPLEADTGGNNHLFFLSPPLKSCPCMLPVASLSVMSQSCDCCETGDVFGKFIIVDALRNSTITRLKGNGGADS